MTRMRNSKFLTGIISIAAVFTLSACAESGDHTHTPNEDSTNIEMNEGHKSHDGMNHSGSGEVPKDLAVAENPTYPVDSQAIIQTDHMKGMQGAVGIIAGAYTTTVYSVSYTPTTGGEQVKDHKWVIHEEIDKHDKEPFKEGDEVTLRADHMEGMDGATAVIDSAEATTVYMVNYKDTESGEEVTNHKWVTEAELSPVE